MQNVKIKVLFMAYCSADTIQAQDRDAINWALYLDPKKYDIWLFCKNKADERFRGKDNIHIVYLNSKFKILNVLKYFYYLVLKTYDVMIISKYEWIARAYLKWFKRMGNARKILIGIVNQVPYDNNKFTSFIRGSKHIFAISMRIKQGIKDYVGIEVPVVHLCYDLSLFEERLNKNERKQIVCVASLNAHKQPFLYANIAKETPEADFYWVGDGYYMSWLNRKIKEDNISNLKMTGAMNQIDLARFLTQCDIFLFPSIHEGFPNAVAEALASGLPVIAFDTYGPEAVIDSETGYVVKTEFEMLEKLKYLLSQPAVLRIFSENARKRAMAFEGSTIISELENLIDEVTRNGGK